MQKTQKTKVSPTSDPATSNNDKSKAPTFPEDPAAKQFPNLDLWPYLSLKTQRAMIHSVFFGTWFCSHPHYYDKTTHRFYLSTGARLLFFRMGFVVVFSTVVFAIIRYFMFKSTMSTETSVASQFIIAVLAFPLGGEINYMIIGDEFSELANQGILFFRDFSQYAIKNYQVEGERLDKNLWKLDALSRITIVSYLTGASATALAFSFIAYQGPLFLPSLVDPSSWTFGYVVMRVLHAMIMSFVMYCFITPAVWHMLQLLHFTFPMLAALKHMINAQDGRNKRELMEDIQWYSKMQLVVNLLSESVGHFVLPYGEAVLLVFSSYGIYALMRLSGLVSFAVFSVGLNAAVSLFFLFRYFGEYDARSQTLLEIWRKKTDDAYSRRLVKSLRPLRVKLADNFIDVPIVLTLVDIIINNTITLLYL